MADDVTGALDTASQFACRIGAVPLYWDGDVACGTTGSYAINTETRDADADAACAVVARRMEFFHGADIAFKKIDSLLRGHVAAEIGTCAEVDLFGSIVIAPAFPAQGRITRGGMQYHRPPQDEDWRPVTRALDREFAALGHKLRLLSRPSELHGRGIFLCDAESDDDLARIAEASRRMDAPRLWCGTAGLARALSGRSSSVPAGPLRAPLLLLVGSDHAIAAAQIDALAIRLPGAVIAIQSGDAADIDAAIAAVARRLARGDTAAVAFRPTAVSRRHAVGTTISRAFEVAAAQLPRPGTVFVMGGETCHRLCRALMARTVSCMGDVYTGVPYSIIRGGIWDGVPLVTKSGAFGDPRALVDLVDRAEGVTHAGV